MKFQVFVPTVEERLQVYSVLHRLGYVHSRHQGPPQEWEELWAGRFPYVCVNDGNAGGEPFGGKYVVGYVLHDPHRGELLPLGRFIKMVHLHASSLAAKHYTEEADE